MTTIYPIGNAKRIFLQAMAIVVDGDYEIDDENRKQIGDLVGYFSRTLTELNPRKGILLYGNPGSGKTILLETFGLLVRNTPMAFKNISCADAARNYSLTGDKSLKGICTANYFFDDLGNETAANHFGRRELMSDIIFDCYNAWRKSGYMYHFTTNSTKEEIISRYGLHSWSRLDQMCNRIGLGIQDDSNDRRTSTLPNVISDTTTFPKFFETDQERKDNEDRRKIHDWYSGEMNKPKQSPIVKPLGQRVKESLGITG